MDILKTELKDIIAEIVNRAGPIKGVDLALKVLDRTLPSYMPQEVYAECLNELIKEGRILELEYTMPEMDSRIKSLFFPKGSSFKQSRAA